MQNISIILKKVLAKITYETIAKLIMLTIMKMTIEVTVKTIIKLVQRQVKMAYNEILHQVNRAAQLLVEV